RAHAGQQLGKGKGFHQIIVRAQLQTLHSVFHRVACRQEKYRRLFPLVPQFAQDRPAVELRQHHVENNEIVAVGPCPVQTIVARRSDVDDETAFGESFRKKGGDLFFVFHEQQSHGETRPP